MKTTQDTPLEKAVRIIQGMIDEATRTNVSAPRFRATLKHLWVKDIIVTYESSPDEIYRGPGRVKAVIEFSTLKEFQQGFKKWFPNLGNDLLDMGWSSTHNDLIL